ncbi:MAG: hypothetical protein COW00_16625 [Bdellovibrio sp. CG12_big_fil_rev_8_21_14_0_65_39_13]|nr:MAG: hypothetical protein COW78_09915 [Bdellovibrio sp. CG22_combo_CG10-13_8_21_14_all_39_27]PIQ58233.1 MAG: hypothetical protein COW00_16625 [Bdellovibrio sp. CG12_big_fil_rev_8_21_14_0_65_39_13]PIR36642.1 MAG: hypothetical protein COV37_02145 [Bdellovibrio sp. CG11_big_fil_rev_8_21_14_0_20_39_38]PJB53389.1 MAG: hypothetical protein CO099_07505 [Bdellovibrio sp. CG_4_9_14_3_um_filter_39_7]
MTRAKILHNNGTVLVIVDEVETGALVCLYPDGEKKIHHPSQLNWDTMSEFAHDDNRLSEVQKEILFDNGRIPDLQDHLESARKTA